MYSTRSVKSNKEKNC